LLDRLFRSRPNDDRYNSLDRPNARDERTTRHILCCFSELTSGNSRANACELKDQFLITRYTSSLFSSDVGRTYRRPAWKPPAGHAPTPVQRPANGRNHANLLAADPPLVALRGPHTPHASGRGAKAARRRTRSPAPKTAGAEYRGRGARLTPTARADDRDVFSSREAGETPRHNLTRHGTQTCGSCRK
jgi:hypothetical protein